MAAPQRTAHSDDSVDSLRVRPRGWSRRQAPWLVLAALLIAGGALTVAVLVSDLASRTPVIALAGGLERGDKLARADVQVVPVALDGQVPTITADRMEEVVGRTLAASLPAGSLLSPDVLSRADVLPADADVVGMLLEPGGYPVADLAVGDRVRIISAADAEGGGRAPSGWLTDADVFAVGDEEATAAKFVSLLVPVDAVDDVTSAAAAGQIRLVLTGTSQ